MKRLLILGGLFGALLFPQTGWAQEDLFSVSKNTVGSPRYTEIMFGYNNAIATAEESVWDGDDAGGAAAGPVRCFANMNTGTTPTAANLFISSDDEGDAPGGDTTDGVIVTVEALDANWDPITITGVNLGVANAGGTLFKQIGSVALMRVNRVYVTSATPTGNLYIGLDSVTDTGDNGIPDTIATDHIAWVQIGFDELQQACYSVPNDYNAFITNVCMSHPPATGTGTIDFRIRSSVNGAVSRLIYRATLLLSTQVCHTFPTPLRFAELTDIEVTGLGSTSESGSATLSLVLIKNTLSGL